MTEMEKLKSEREKIIRAINQLENRQKVLLSKELDEERRARTRRLIERGAMLESVFPVLRNCENDKVMALLIAFSRLPEATDILGKVIKPNDAG